MAEAQITSAPEGSQRRQRINLSSRGELTGEACKECFEQLARSFSQKPSLQRVVLTGMASGTGERMIQLAKSDHRVRCLVSHGPSGEIVLVLQRPGLKKEPPRKIISCEVDGQIHSVAFGRRRRQMQTVIERDGSLCVWCSKELSAEHPQASLDHLIPDSRGGSVCSWNALLSCQHCNNSRGTTDAFTWMLICRARGLELQEQVFWDRFAAVLLR